MKNKDLLIKSINEYISNFSIEDLARKEIVAVSYIDKNSDAKILEFKNIAVNNDEFEIADKDIEKLSLLSLSHSELSEAQCSLIVFHTHIKAEHNDFSVQDIITSKEWNLAFYMVNIKTGITKYYDPNEITPYVGREWSWSSCNCYTILQDVYKNEFNIELDDFYLDSEHAYKSKEFNSYLENIESQGFYQIHDLEDVQYGDLLLFTIAGFNPNHIGIMMDPQSNNFIHHLTNKLSQESVLDQRYRQRLHSIWRHKEVTDNERESSCKNYWEARQKIRTRN